MDSSDLADLLGLSGLTVTPINAGGGVTSRPPVPVGSAVSTAITPGPDLGTGPSTGTQPVVAQPAIQPTAQPQPPVLVQPASSALPATSLQGGPAPELVVPVATWSSPNTLPSGTGASPVPLTTNASVAPAVAAYSNVPPRHLRLLTEAVVTEYEVQRNAWRAYGGGNLEVEVRFGQVSLPFYHRVQNYLERRLHLIAETSRDQVTLYPGNLRSTRVGGDVDWQSKMERGAQEYPEYELRLVYAIEQSIPPP
jgi:hypothetical protein